jgi:hypothetical protein
MGAESFGEATETNRFVARPDSCSTSDLISACNRGDGAEWGHVVGDGLNALRPGQPFPATTSPRGCADAAPPLPGIRR